MADVKSINRDARFYMANLAADVSRCAAALQENNESRYKESLARAHRTLSLLHDTSRPEAYEEALLMLRALEYARAAHSLAEFRSQLDTFCTPLLASMMA